MGCQVGSVAKGLDQHSEQIPPRPILGKFSEHNSCATVWSLKGTHIWIGEDFPTEIESRRNNYGLTFVQSELDILTDLKNMYLLTLEWIT